MFLRSEAGLRVEASSRDSALTTDEFAAIRSVGFEAVGQVLGAGVFNIGYTGGYNCPGPFGDGMVSPDRMVTEVSGRGGSGSFGPLVQTLYKARAPPSPG